MRSFATKDNKNWLHDNHVWRGGKTEQKADLRHIR